MHQAVSLNAQQGVTLVDAYKHHDGRRCSTCTNAPCKLSMK